MRMSLNTLNNYDAVRGKMKEKNKTPFFPSSGWFWFFFSFLIEHTQMKIWE